MKKLIIIAVVVAAGIAGLMVVKNRMGVQIFSSTNGGADLSVLNDSKDTISAEYKEGGKEAAFVVKPGDKVSGGKGFLRIFTAKKDGSYELIYAFPRPAGASQEIALSQVVEAAQQKKDLGDAVYTEKGMLGDIKVVYEEARVLDSTY